MNSALFIFAAIPAILYSRSTLKKLYKTYMKSGMSFQEVCKALNIQPSLATTTGTDTEEVVEVFEYENNDPEKYILVFINGKLNEWYTELKRSMEG